MDPILEDLKTNLLDRTLLRLGLVRLSHYNNLVAAYRDVCRWLAKSHGLGE